MGSTCLCGIPVWSTLRLGPLGPTCLSGALLSRRTLGVAGVKKHITSMTFAFESSRQVDAVAVLANVARLGAFVDVETTRCVGTRQAVTWK